MEYKLNKIIVIPETNILLKFKKCKQTYNTHNCIRIISENVYI